MPAPVPGNVSTPLIPEDWLAALEWDGVPRLSLWLTRCLGAPDTPEVAAVGRDWLVCAVGRAFAPGSACDVLPILMGPQGCGKSTAIEILGGAWYRQLDMQGWRQASMDGLLGGAWICEVAAESLLGIADPSPARFLTARADRCRAPYARSSVTIQRRAVFVVTSNAQRAPAYKGTPQTVRPVSVGPCDHDLLRAWRDQLWAEAVAAWRAGEPGHLRRWPEVAAGVGGAP